MTRNLVETVTGPIPVEKLGVTLMHEHIVVGYPGWEADTRNPVLKRSEMLAIAKDRVQAMQAHGITSMVDPCPNDLGRDLTLAAEVASATGFNIICATGLYKEDEGGHSHWNFSRMVGVAVDAMTELFIRELTVGVGDTGIKAGIIKVATGNGVITDYEYDVLTAAARAAVETGAPITTHTDHGTMGEEQQAFLTEHGVEPHKIIIGHSCGSDDHNYHMNILQRGSYLGFDRFGIDFLMPDERRIENLTALLKKNQHNKIVVSHDSVWCTRGKPFPDELLANEDPDRLFDPTHFHRNIIPQLLKRGVTQEQIDTMLVENPKRFFTGKKI